MQEPGELPEAYAAWNLDEAVRAESSSGGIFSLLAERVLKNGGAVYGAAMDNCRVHHIRAVSSGELFRLRGSKYVQSDIGDTFIQARKDLNEGRLVLFTGTPCQIEGLQRYLGSKYDNLLCMDIICHGVPSPLVWGKYVSYRETVAAADAQAVCFREKQYGWHNYSMYFAFDNDTVYRSKHGEDPYMRAYLRNLMLRPSCYQCRFKKVNRCSDLTVADFWGIEKICPEMDDGKGCSLVIVHSEKGQKIVSEMGSSMYCRPMDIQSAMQFNPSMTESVAKPEKRDLFLRDIQRQSFDKVVARYAKRRRRGIRRFVQKLFSR